MNFCFVRKSYLSSCTDNDNWEMPNLRRRSRHPTNRTYSSFVSSLTKLNEQFIRTILNTQLNLNAFRKFSSIFVRKTQTQTEQVRSTTTATNTTNTINTINTVNTVRNMINSDAGTFLTEYWSNHFGITTLQSKDILQTLQSLNS